MIPVRRLRYSTRLVPRKICSTYGWRMERARMDLLSAVAHRRRQTIDITPDRSDHSRRRAGVGCEAGRAPQWGASRPALSLDAMSKRVLLVEDHDDTRALMA